MKDCLDILVIDDDEVDRMNVQHLLDKEGVKAVVHEASDCKYWNRENEIQGNRLCPDRLQVARCQRCRGFGEINGSKPE